MPARACPRLPAPARACPHPPKKDRPVAPTRPNGFVNHVAMVAKKILILRAEARMDSFFNLLSGFISGFGSRDSGAHQGGTVNSFDPQIPKTLTTRLKRS